VLSISPLFLLGVQTGTKQRDRRGKVKKSGGKTERRNRKRIHKWRKKK